MRNRIFGILACLFVLLQGALFFVIPSRGASVFLSPDETANAVSARTFAQQGNMRYEEPLLEQFPWLHPRSFVTQGTAMVPVGFLGMSLLLGVIWKFVGDWGLVLFTPLLALSVVFPLWRLTAKWGRASQFATILTWLSFPTVILYANRGLFANLPVVCLTVWACFLLQIQKSKVESRKSIKSLYLILAGLAVGFAIAMRPTEVVWIVPWIWLAIRPLSLRRRGLGEVLAFGFALFLPLLLALFVAWKTYGSPFAVGYFLRDPIVSSVKTATHDALLPTPVIRWPFGFHPRNILFNVFHYFGNVLWEWTAIVFIAALISWKQKEARPYLLVAGWTIFSFVLIYGQAIYQDHVGVNVVSLGNSFLRYVLPFSVIAALASGFVCKKITERFSDKKGTFVCALLVVLLVTLGTRTALIRDDEGVIASSQELQRYQEIREAALENLGENAVILSDRGDKIFFPTFRGVSPLPNMDTLGGLICVRVLNFFSQTLNPQELKRWWDAGFYFVPIYENKNQTLYQDKDDCGAGS